MKKLLVLFAIFNVLVLLYSCEKDEGRLPSIGFKAGGSYISSDTTISGSVAITMGIIASKSEKKDVLKKFNISKSVNGGAATSVFDKSLSGSEGDDFKYDHSTTVETTVGQSTKYIFTVTNRDGLTNQVSLSVKTK